ncbi:restriction endonuclease subunit S [Blastococcus sp. CCUG 61487]|uniref:restriction endonuclease subunit S n=1 Tax=Blastococcus sp. CCUG 61487 TaxID=1840703 RepID=UPI0010BF8747|nr:restriction endonuclease subunit S [Blastococcus sp. CCUG 61487]TKJ28314.1 hypothetical protein A6V29_02620 [Blastococcus sp. CCUG 61487]
MPDWLTAPLHEVLEFREGPGIMAVDFRSHGVPLIRLAGLKRGSDLLTGCNYLDPVEVERRWKQFRVKEGDVLLSTSASLGEVAVAGKSHEGAVPYTGIIAFRPRDERILPEFIPHMLTNVTFVQQIQAMGVGSVMKHFGPSHLRKMTVTFPASVRDQRAIAEVLAALDDKIAANALVANAATSLAAAHYEALAERSTDVRALGEVASTALGGTPSRSVPEFWVHGTVPWLASGKANEPRVLTPTAWITAEALASSASKMMPKGATLLAITGATLGQVARLEIDACGNQSLIGIWHEDQGMNDWLYFAVQQQLPELLKHATGAAQQHVNKQNVERLLVPLPATDVLELWGQVARPLLDTAAAMDQQALHLAQTRDELLPLLMCDRITVRGVEDSAAAMT